VCRALIEPQQAYGSTLHEGETYFFCCPVCHGAFQKDPNLYLNKKQIPDVQSV
jgi:YHS domain-containing protein